MRAAASSVCRRASNWQSQRVTRRSFLGSGIRSGLRSSETVFQPVPLHSGQTPAEDWAKEALIAETVLKEALFTQTLFPMELSRLVRLCTGEPTSRKS